MTIQIVHFSEEDIDFIAPGRNVRNEQTYY